MSWNCSATMRVLAGLGLVNHGHVAIPLKFREMAADQIAQFVGGVFGLVDLLPKRSNTCWVL